MRSFKVELSKTKEYNKVQFWSRGNQDIEKLKI